MDNNQKRRIPLSLSIFVLIVLIGGIYFYFFHHLRTASGYQSTKTKLAELEEELLQSQFEKSQLSDALYSTQKKLAIFEIQALELIEQVGTYRKLDEIEPELLQKYSKVYFLNEHYEPPKLTNIKQEYLVNKSRVMQIDHRVEPFLHKMLDSATRDGLNLRVASAYRSFTTQSTLKANYKIIYGTTAANRFSADQGYSEHQLGTTVDLTTAKSGDLSTSFELTPEFKWLQDNAYRYGFVLSYPKGNKYYIYEPWHWRFVGTDLANYLFQERKGLYDLDQREIDEYLVTIFD